MSTTGLYWISYAGEDEALGICAVFAHHQDHARQEAIRLGLEPPGTVQTMVAMFPCLPEGMPLNRFFTPTEIENAGWGKRCRSLEEFEAMGNVIVEEITEEDEPNPD